LNIKTGKGTAGSSAVPLFYGMTPDKSEFDIASPWEGEGNRLRWRGRKNCRNVQKIDLSVSLCSTALLTKESQVGASFSYKFPFLKIFPNTSRKRPMRCIGLFLLCCLSAFSDGLDAASDQIHRDHHRADFIQIHRCLRHRPQGHRQQRGGHAGIYQ